MVSLHPKDRQDFVNYLNDTLSDQQSYNLARSTIDRDDYRKVKPQTMGIKAESREFIDEFSKSDSYRNTNRAFGLLSHDFSVSEDNLSNVLSRTGLSRNEIKDVFSQLHNHKDVEAHFNKFTKETSYRRRY